MVVMSEEDQEVVTVERFRELCEERAGAGSVYLDEYHAGWEVYIDLSKLDLAQAHACIVGQVGQAEASFNLQRTLSLETSEGYFPPSLGFEIGEERVVTESGTTLALTSMYGILQEVWVGIVKARREGGPIGPRT